MLSRRFAERESRVALGCGGVAAGTGLASIAASQNGHLSATAAVHIARTDAIAPMALRADPHFQLVSTAQHYDGAYYYAIARDPLIRGSAHRLIDQPGYRYGHPLHGWLADLLSLGRAGAVPLALLLLGLLGLAVAGWAVSRLAVHHERSPWGGLLVAASPGLLFATTVDTTETVGAALIALCFLAWVRARIGMAVLLIVLACLDKEQYITVPVGLLVWEAVQWRRTRARPDQLPQKLVAVGVGPLVLTGWYLYVHARIGSWPFDYESGNLGPPFVGWKETFRLAHNLSGGTFDQAEIGDVAPVVLVATALVLVAATVAAIRIRSVFDATAIGMAVITSLQGWRTLLYPHEIFRTPAIAVLLATAVLLTRRRTPLPSPAG